MQNYSKHCNYATKPVFLKMRRMCSSVSNTKLLSPERANRKTRSAGRFCTCYTGVASLTAAVIPDWHRSHLETCAAHLHCRRIAALCEATNLETPSFFKPRRPFWCFLNGLTPWAAFTWCHISWCKHTISSISYLRHLILFCKEVSTKWILVIFEAFFCNFLDVYSPCKYLKMETVGRQSQSHGCEHPALWISWVQTPIAFSLWNRVPSHTCQTNCMPTSHKSLCLPERLVPWTGVWQPHTW